MSTIFTFPGKIGDALLQFPVAAAWHREHGKPYTVWLDEKTLGPIKNLIAAQPGCEAVEMKPGIVNYGCGGQPWHFDANMADLVGHTIYHLGFRKFPERQITLQTALDCGFDVDTEALAREPGLTVGFTGQPENRLLLHGTFTSHQTGVPRFWRFLRDRRDELESRFKEIVFTGTKDERDRALELYPRWGQFDDQGDFLELAKLMAASRMVIASGSSAAALAGALKVPCVRVHDPIGDANKHIWSNLGENQLNDTDADLRRSWPDFVAKWAPERSSVVVIE